MSMYIVYETIMIMYSCDHDVVLLYTATVVLDSSVGMRGACPGETVTYTCAVNQGFALDWIVEPFLPASARILFRSTDTIGSMLDCSGVASVQCEDFDFVATLTATANPTVVMTTTLADMTSTLTFATTARLNGTVVQCRGSTAAGFPLVNNSLNVAGAPIMYMLYCLAIVSCCLVTKTLPHISDRQLSLVANMSIALMTVTNPHVYLLYGFMYWANKLAHFGYSWCLFLSKGNSWI